MNRLTKFTLAIALQLVIILCIILVKLVTLFTGTEILLAIAPVDPRSPLRGDYVTFQYRDISQIDPYIMRDRTIANGDTVYVVLSQEEMYWTPERIHKVPPEKGEVFLKGKVVSGGIRSDAGFTDDLSGSGGNLHIVYGIEEYFVPEGAGRDANIFRNDPAARVAVDTNGNGVLKGLLVDGKKWP